MASFCSTPDSFVKGMLAAMLVLFLGTAILLSEIAPLWLTTIGIGIVVSAPFVGWYVSDIA